MTYAAANDASVRERGRFYRAARCGNAVKPKQTWSFSIAERPCGLRIGSWALAGDGINLSRKIAVGCSRRRSARRRERCQSANPARIGGRRRLNVNSMLPTRLLFSRFPLPRAIGRNFVRRRP
jgi:hypothetical protein